MIDAPIGLAFAAGAVAAFNPCGFALLPGYLSYYLGGEAHPGVRRGVMVAGSVTAGFALVFGLLGALIVSVSSAFLEWAPWASIVIGIAMVPLGVSLIRGRQLEVRLPGLKRTASGTGPTAMFVYGIGFALASLACTIPPFLVTVSTTFGRSNFASGMAVFGAYVGGMALVLVTLTVAVALARIQLVDRLRRVLPHVTKVSGWLVVTAAVYVIYYGWFQLRVLQGDPVLTGPADAVASVSETVSRFVNGLGFGWLVAAGVAVIAVGYTLRWRADTAQEDDVVDMDEEIYV